jgi:hypothetical protein
MNGIDLEALRALRDCGVVRARLFDDRYSDLVARGIAAAIPFPQHEDDPHPRRDFHLTTRGAIVADAILTVGP